MTYIARLSDGHELGRYETADEAREAAKQAIAEAWAERPGVRYVVTVLMEGPVFRLFAEAPPDFRVIEERGGYACPIGPGISRRRMAESEGAS